MSGPVLGAAAALLGGLLVAQLMDINTVAPLLLMAVIVFLIVAMDPFRGVVVLLFISQFNGLRFDYGSLTVRPEHLFLLVGIAAWLVSFLRMRSRIHATLLDIPIIVLITAGFASSFLYSPSLVNSLQGSYLQIIYVLMYFYTVNVLLDNRPRLDFMVKLLMVIAVLHAIYSMIAVGGYFAGINLGGISSSHLTTLEYPSASGFFQEANLLGAFTAMMMILLMSHFVSREGGSFSRPALLLGGIVILLFANFLSMTRAAWNGLAIALLAMIFIFRPKWNVINPRSVGLLGALLMGFALIVYPLVNYAFSASAGKSDVLKERLVEIVDFGSGSGKGRVKAQDAAMDEWRENPLLGKGVLSFDKEVEGTPRGAWLYSSFVQATHDTGIVGAAAVILIHVLPVLYALYASTRAETVFRRASLIGLGLGAMIMAIGSQASSFFWLGFPWIYLGILVALAKDTLETARDAGGEEAA